MLAAEGDRVWARVDAMIETKKPAEYDRAVDLLEDLRDVPEPSDFARRVAEMRVWHARKSSLMNRFDLARL
jgi:hypothetical protein